MLSLPAVFVALAIAADPPGLFLGRSVRDWTRDLADGRPEVRRSAAFAMGKLGAEARPAVPDLVRLVRADGSHSVRDMAAAALGDLAATLGAEGAHLWREAGPTLIEVLSRDRAAQARRSAAFALGNFGPIAKDARAALTKALNDGDAAVRQNAAWALGRLGSDATRETVAALCERLKDSQPLVRRDAALALGSIGPPHARAAIKPLFALVRETTDEVVLQAALEPLTALAGPEDRADAAFLVSLLNREDIDTRRLAAFVLARLGGPEAGATLSVLRPLLREPDSKMQEVTAAALAALGPAAAPAVLDLAALLDDKADPVVVRNAVLALGAIGKESAPAVPQITRLLAPGRPRDLRLYAAEALKRIESPGLDTAIPALLTVIRADDDPTVRQRCILAVWQVDDLKRVNAVDTLTACLAEQGPETALVRYAAAIVLAFHQRFEAPERAADVLRAMLQDRTLITRSYSDVAVGSATSEGRSGRSEVQETSRGDARWLAAEALGAMGRKANRPEVLEALRDAARDTDAKLKASAAKAIERIRR